MNTWFLDKPSIAVSWHAETLGMVYVAYVRIDPRGQNASEIHVARSDDGGQTFVETAVLGGLQRVQSPTLAVNFFTGDVYLFWINYAARTIDARKSDASATAFAVLPSRTTGALFDNVGDTFCATGGICMQARSVLTARYNIESNEVGLLWNEREAGNNNQSDVRFAALTYNDSWTAVQTVHETQIGGTSTYNQWDGALDANGQGFLVTFYDTRNSATTQRFDVYTKKITSTGTPFDLYDTRVTPVSGVTTAMRPIALNTYTLGEYQDVWQQSGWKSSFVHAPDPAGGGSGVCDVYWSTIVP
jgi:hypothetical protein